MDGVLIAAGQHSAERAIAIAQASLAAPPAALADLTSRLAPIHESFMNSLETLHRASLSCEESMVCSRDANATTPDRLLERTGRVVNWRRPSGGVQETRARRGNRATHRAPVAAAQRALIGTHWVDVISLQPTGRPAFDSSGAPVLLLTGFWLDARLRQARALARTWRAHPERSFDARVEYGGAAWNCPGVIEGLQWEGELGAARMQITLGRPLRPAGAVHGDRAVAVTPPTGSAGAR